MYHFDDSLHHQAAMYGNAGVSSGAAAGMSAGVSMYGANAGYPGSSASSVYPQNHCASQPVDSHKRDKDAIYR